MKNPVRSVNARLFVGSLLLWLSSVTIPVNAALPFFGDDNNESMPTLAPMIERTSPGIVSISVQGTKVSEQAVPEMFRYFFGAPNEQRRERPFRGLGSGVIINATDGLVVTNSHVVENAETIIVTLSDGREIEAEKLGEDKQSDVALLKIDADDLVEVPLADSNALRVGDFVVAIGNPFGLSQTVTSGIVSALGRSGLNIGGYEDYIQTDAAINRGNSGGALVDLKGRLVGINTAIFGPNGGNVGIGFAIPSNMMKQLVDQIIEFGEVRRGLLGILGNDVDASLAEAVNSDVNVGAFINEVQPDSAADKAGLLPGDIIIELDGSKIDSFSELRAKVASMGAGAEIDLKVVRQGERLEFPVTLGDAGASTVSAEEIHPAFEGSTFSGGSNDAGVQGIIVEDITRGSPAARSGLKQDDVIVSANRQRVTTVGELKAVIEQANDTVALEIVRGNQRLFLVLRQN